MIDVYQCSGSFEWRGNGNEKRNLVGEPQFVILNLRTASDYELKGGRAQRPKRLRRKSNISMSLRHARRRSRSVNSRPRLVPRHYRNMRIRIGSRETKEVRRRLYGLLSICDLKIKQFRQRIKAFFRGVLLDADQRTQSCSPGNQTCSSEPVQLALGEVLRGAES